MNCISLLLKGVLIRNLTFLAKLLERDDVLSSHVFQTLVPTNVYEVSLVQQCRVLEQQIGTGCLQLCLQNPTNASSIVHEAKSEILAKDWNCTIQASRSHHSLAIVSATDVIASGWNRIWDEALEYGVLEPDLCRVWNRIWDEALEYGVLEPDLCRVWNRIWDEALECGVLGPHLCRVWNRIWDEALEYGVLGPHLCRVWNRIWDEALEYGVLGPHSCRVWNRIWNEALEYGVLGPDSYRVWNRIWDEALEYGVLGPHLCRVSLARPTFGDKVCPCCNETI